MGYCVTAHVLKERADFTRLRELPRSIGTRVYYHRKAKLYVVDVFRLNKQPEYPFQTPLPTADIPLELPPKLQNLEAIYSFLSKARIANGFKKSYINFCCSLSSLLNAAVFSMISDDDEHDFACAASAGELRRLKCRCADLMTFYDGINTQVIPLVPEAEDDEGYLTDPTSLKAAAPGIEVLPRTTPWDTQLHAIAIAELKTFAGLDEPILGLGSFDPPEDEADWELVVG